MLPGPWPGGRPGRAAIPERRRGSAENAWLTDVMEGYGPATYGDRIADVYDQLYGEAFDVSATVDALAGLAGGGRSLELAIGTGRVALPLRARGIEVEGIDASEAMVERMRAKPGGRDVPVTFGDFADVAVEGDFQLIFIVFNTLFALTTQDDQARCFANVARRLSRGGSFVVEAFVPDLGRFDRDQRVHASEVRVDRVMLDVSRHDAVNQVVTSQHLLLTGEETRMYPVHIRYAWPSELDLMARLAGLKLRDRWGGWKREKFDSSSWSHVSMYELD
jgi:SAM-dependent methyltransferase